MNKLAVAGLRKVENQRSSSGPRNTVRRRVSEATASGVTPVGDGVSSRARVPPVLGADRARAQVRHVPLAVRGAHEAAVTGLHWPTRTIIPAYRRTIEGRLRALAAHFV